jgi:hypothetical protein
LSAPRAETKPTRSGRDTSPMELWRCEKWSVYKQRRASFRFDNTTAMKKARHE